MMTGRRDLVIFAVHMPDCYEGMDAKLTGFAKKAYLKKTAIPTIQANPTPGQIQEALSLKKKTYICGNAG